MLLYYYGNPYALLEAWARFVGAFADEVRQELGRLKEQSSHASPEEETLLFQGNMIQIALFQRYLKRKSIRCPSRLDEYEEPHLNRHFGHWVRSHGEKFERLFPQYRADWWPRFVALDPLVNTPLAPNATPSERHRRRRAETEWDLLIEEIEGLI